MRAITLQWGLTNLCRASSVLRIEFLVSQARADGDLIARDASATLVFLEFASGHYFFSSACAYVLFRLPPNRHLVLKTITS